MRNPAHEEETRQLLSSLPSGQEPVLLHLLNCPACRELAMGWVLAEQSASPAEEPVPDYGPVFERLACPPELLEEIDRRRAEAEQLLAELTSLPREQRQQVIEAVRFRDPAVLELILDESDASQVSDPARADELASLAAALAQRLEDTCRVAEGLARALCLAGNARRLLGDAISAEVVFRQAAVFVTHPDERASYCRALALLRWEQGHLDEAAALLRYGGELFAVAELPAEEGACLALLGVLYTEANLPATALAPLMRSRAFLDASHRPWLSLRSCLALALCHAELGQLEKSGKVLEEAWRLYTLVQDERELIHAYWQEGRIIARLDKREEAAQVLESVRRKYLAAARLPEAALVSLDLAALRVQLERPAELHPLIEELEAAFAGHAGLEPALRAVRNLLAEIVGVESEPWDSVEAAASFIRQTLRFRGIRVEPIPFA